MRYLTLGAKGPQISALGLGCMSFGESYGPTTLDESLATLDAAYEAGITFYDTANIYGRGLSEEVLGTWLARRRPEIVLATKASIVLGPPRSFNNSEAYLRQELEASLKRLGRERVELFYIHRRDHRMPIEEVVGTLGRLIDEGKIGAYGLSEISPATLRRAHAERACAAVQNEYSLWSRQPELGLIEACGSLGVAFIPFSPLGRGILTDLPPDPARFDPADFRRENPRFMAPAHAANEAFIAPFRAYARERGIATAALALAWVLDQGPHLAPIPGTRSVAHLRDLLAGEALRLTEEDRAHIARMLPAGFAEGDRYGDQQTAAVERYC